MAYSNDNLLETVKRRASVPTSQSTFQDSDILEIATEELKITMVPLITSVREEYFVWEQDYDFSTDGEQVNGRYEFEINARAVAQGLRDLKYVQNNAVKSIPKIDPEQEERQTGSLYTSDMCFYLRWNTIVIPGTSLTGTLRQVFNITPSDLVATTACARIASIDTATKTVTTVSPLPTAFTTGQVYDFIRQIGGHEFRAIDQAVTSAAGSSMTFSATLPTRLAVGDWVAIAGQSPVPQLPDELMPILSQRVVCHILEAQGDHAGLEKARETLKRFVEDSKLLISPRVQGEAKVIVSGNYQRWWQ